MRSALFVPGSHARRIEKALGLTTDAVILDLEDAVAPQEKELARQTVLAALRRPKRGATYVRINAMTSDQWQRDLEVVVAAGLDGIVLPKTEHARELRELDCRVSARERGAGISPGSIELLPLIESASGLFRAVTIARASRRVRRLAFGAADYTSDLGLQWSEDERELDHARATLTHASRVAGIEAPIDSVVLQVREVERFRDSARLARRLGFQGKLCLHPDQVAPCNEIFSPTAAEIARATKVVAAFEQAESQGCAAFSLDGSLVDYAIVRKARGILALAQRMAPHS